MKKLSTVIITFNEEKNIERCLKSAAPVSDEIVVVDSSSSDRTVDIARKCGGRVIQHAFEGHVQQKNFALAQASNDWVLALDADECVSPELAEGIMRFKMSDEAVDACYVSRRTFYLTDWFTRGGWYPDRKIRLFSKKQARWEGRNPHDYVQPAPTARVGFIHGDLLHYTYADLTQHVERIQSFSGIAAAEKQGRHVCGVRFRVFVNPIFKFVKTYFYQKAFLEGTRGFVFSVMASFSVFLKYAKLWELGRKNHERVG
jgi:glycosyltransferase involved in cell wall biosynthesis